MHMEVLFEVGRSWKRWFYGDGAYGISEERRPISGNRS